MHDRYRTLSLHSLTIAASIAVLCILGWEVYDILSPIPLQTVSTMAETRTILLPDQTEVVLNRYSSLTYPQRFKGKTREVRLTGEGYFKVTKDAAHPFKVNTEALDVEVLGTDFNVEAYPKSPVIKTTLLEGSVAVNLTEGRARTLMLNPNESAVYDKSNQSLIKQTEENASGEVAWQDGTLLFRNTALHEIMQQLSNAFNVNIQIKDSTIKDYHMTATFSNRESLDEILSLLSSNKKFNYTSKQNAIIITE